MRKPWLNRVLVASDPGYRPVPSGTIGRVQVEAPKRVIVSWANGQREMLDKDLVNRVAQFVDGSA
jgi:hypothetical protein